MEAGTLTAHVVAGFSPRSSSS